jgi:fatty acid desaturase
MTNKRIASGLHELTTADDRLAVLIIAVDYAAIVGIALFAVIVQNPFITLAAIGCIAGRQVALLNLVHAAAHYTLFSKRKFNDQIDPVIGYPILTRVRPYRLFHLLHHRDIARKSPDRFDYLHAHLPAPDAHAWLRAWHVIVKPLLGWAGYEFVRGAIRGVKDNPRLGWKLAVYWIVLIAGFWRVGWLGFFVTYWILPLVWLYPVFFFWAEMSDHYAARDDARNQRGVFYSLFIKGHEMYHAVHHRYPRIPFYRVRAANRYLRSMGENIEESRGVVDFVRILCRRPPSAIAAEGLAPAAAEFSTADRSASVS